MATQSNTGFHNHYYHPHHHHHHHHAQAISFESGTGLSEIITPPVPGNYYNHHHRASTSSACSRHGMLINPNIVNVSNNSLMTTAASPTAAGNIVYSGAPPPPGGAGGGGAVITSCSSGSNDNSPGNSLGSLLLDTVPGLKHEAGLAVEWSVEEQYKLEEGLVKFADEPSIMKYIKIAAVLGDKTVRDVALRCRWMMDRMESCLKSTTSASPMNLAAYVVPLQPRDQSDSTSPISALIGTTRHLLEENNQALGRVSTNLASLEDYAQLVHKLQSHVAVDQCEEEGNKMMMMVQEECELPLIDLGVLITSESSSDEASKRECMAKIAMASSEWGFFQVVNHGVSSELLRKMREEQIKLFRAPFEKKASYALLNSSYRWGTPTATCPKQFSWSEAFHIPLAKISDQASYGDFTSLREVMVEYAEAMQGVAKLLAGVLAMKMGSPKQVLEEICDENTCFLRLNRYPACPISPEIFGLVPHTDSDFLTILHQDEVGGLQLMKDSKWVAVKPNADALIVNIGDLFQAWSNDAYKSVEHKVMVKRKVERFSIAYFLCPSYESEIGSCKREPSASVYKAFTFGQYRHQVREDVKFIGHKVGLSRFRV